MSMNDFTNHQTGYCVILMVSGLSQNFELVWKKPGFPKNTTHKH
jgi:hypothetical protein